MWGSARYGSSSRSTTPDFILDVIPCKMSTEQVDILRKLSKEPVIAKPVSRLAVAIRFSVEMGNTDSHASVSTGSE